MAALFWLAAGLLVYSYFVYPLLLKLISRPANATAPEPEVWPSVNIVLSAYNEEDCIGERIRNLLGQDYPGELHILVGSDGSTDGTQHILDGITDSRVTVQHYADNRGKISVLNDLVSNANADILVFTDANTVFTPATVRTLAASFTPGVGGVCGELHLHTPGNSQNADGLYWRYETFLKRAESSLGALLGANGAVYAIRRELYQPLDESTIVDDFCIAMNVSRQGYRFIYNDAACAHEEVAPTLRDEFGRRVRIGAGNYQALARNLWALSPFRGLLAWAFWSHKVIRWFGPHLMLLAFIANCAILPAPIYLAALLGQLGFYGVAILGSRRIHAGKAVGGAVQAAAFFVTMNLALWFGFWRYLSGNTLGSWHRTPRQAQ